VFILIWTVAHVTSADQSHTQFLPCSYSSWPHTHTHTHTQTSQHTHAHTPTHSL